MFEYTVNPTVLEDAYEFVDTGATCLWFEISDVFSAEYRGACDGEELLFRHQLAMDFDLFFNVTASTDLARDLELAHLRAEYFTNDSVTAHTMQQIDDIFESAFELEEGHCL